LLCDRRFDTCFAGVAAAWADGSVLTHAPPTVQLRFSEPVTAGAVPLIDG
jgi:methionine-rich copper-binding protein CopC